MKTAAAATVAACAGAPWAPTAAPAHTPFRSGPRVRLYLSALNDVSYVYGYPVPFSRKPKDLERHEIAKELAEERAAARAEALERAYAAAGEEDRACG